MQFKKGQSGNPAGRPKGAKDRRTLFRDMIDPHKDTLVSKAVEMALNGNESMLRLILERILPAKPKSEAVTEINLSGISPQADGREIIAQVAQGNITPEEGKSLMHVIINQISIIEYTELIYRLDELEKQCR